MNRLAIILCVAVLTTLVAPGVVLAQSDEGNVEVGDPVQTDDEPEQPDRVLEQFGDGAWLSGVQVHNDGTATLHIVTERTLRLSITDSGAIQPEPGTTGSGSFSSDSYNLPSGEYELRVPATQDDEGLIMLTFSGNFEDNRYYYDATNMDDGGWVDGPFDSSEVNLITGLGALLGAVIVVLLLWRKRKRNESEVKEL